jgi:hypothetical protein
MTIAKYVFVGLSLMFLAGCIIRDDRGGGGHEHHDFHDERGSDRR